MNSNNSESKIKLLKNDSDNLEPKITINTVIDKPPEKSLYKKLTIQNSKVILISLLPTVFFLTLLISGFSVFIAFKRNTPQNNSETNPNYTNLHSTPTDTFPDLTVTTVSTPTIFPTKNPPSLYSKDCIYFSDPSNSGVYNSKGPLTINKLLWIRNGDPKKPVKGGATSNPIVACGILYFNNWDGFVYALNADNGQVLWKFKPQSVPKLSPTFAEGYIYFGDNTGNLYAVNTDTQKESWKYTLKNEKNGIKLYGNRSISSTPVVNDNIIYFPDNSGYLYALDAKTGAEKWLFEKNTVFHFTAPAISDGVAYFGDDDSILYALDTKTGAEKWRYKSTGPIFTQPTVYKKKVYVISDDGALHALDIKDGSETWYYKYSKTDLVMRVNPNPVAVYKDAIYLSGTNDYFLDVLDSETGKELWKFQAESWVESQPVIAKDVVYFGTYERKSDHRGYLYAVDINSHNELGKYKIINLGLNDKPFVWENIVYTNDGDGNIFAIK